MASTTAKRFPDKAILGEGRRHKDSRSPRNRSGSRSVRTRPIDRSVQLSAFTRADIKKSGGVTDWMTAVLKASSAERFTIVVIPSGASGANRLHQILAKVAPQNVTEGTNAYDPYEEGRNVVRRLQMAEGGAWSTAEVKHALGVTSAVLHRRRKEFRVIYWRDPKANYFYPKWQFNAAGALLHGIAEIAKIFRSNDEWRIMSYFLTSRKSLGGKRPLDLLRNGQVETAVKQARSHAEENTW